MITDLNKIVKEWSYRVNDGKPNPNNSTHLYHLSEILIENQWPFEVIDELLQNLNEVDIVQKKQSDGSYGSSYTVKKHNPDRGQKLIKKDASPEDVKKIEKDKETKDKEPKKKKPDYEPDFDSSPEEIANKLGGGEFEETSSEKAKKDLIENRKGALSKKRTGKGGSTTTQREELSTISREIALKHSDDTPEKHKERVLDHIRELYRDEPKEAEKIIKQIDKPQKAKNLINTTLSGLKATKILKDKKNGFDMAEKQPKPYPLNVTFTKEATQTTQNLLITKLKEAKTPEERKHYEDELKAFQKMATSSTGTEGDGDTAITYIDSKGRLRVAYSSNKQSLSDAFSNATVKSASEVIKASKVEGANVDALTTQVEDSVADAVEFNKTYTRRNRKIIDENREELNKAPLTKIATKALTGRGIYEPSTDKYIEKARNSKVVKDCIESKGYDIKNDEHVVECAYDVNGKGDTDEINDSVKQAANKLVMKISRTTSKVREVMNREMKKNSDLTVEEAAKLAATLNGGVGGGGLSTQDCLDIYNNKALEKLEKSKNDRDEAITESHAEVHRSTVELDVSYHMEQGMGEEEAREKYEKEAGPHERTVNRAFMKRMHWDRYVDGTDEGRKIIEIGDTTFTTKDFKDCLAKLSDWDGEGKLSDHLEKKVRIKPGTQKLMFVTGEGKEIELGNDTWRTAGDLSKIAGSLGTDLEKCLGDKS